MTRGRVFLPANDSPDEVSGGDVASAIVPLPHLDPLPTALARLSGRYARVHQAGETMLPSAAGDDWRPSPIGDARPDDHGDFLFEPGIGGGRMDKAMCAEPDFRERYIQAAHFGEVNTYFHLDRIATYVHGLLTELGAASLPRVIARVNAHHAAVEHEGLRDGVFRNGHWRAFQGGHYRLPSRKYDIAEHTPLSPHGEIHLGPGWRLTEHGALARAAGHRYRANASHNAGIIYHEYGHHITRHTADFRANTLRGSERQDNRKTAMDEGTSDYFAATMLGTPHIWHAHRRHDASVAHPRSLTSTATMAAFDASRGADPHANGTIWAATLWDLREALRAQEAGGARIADLLVLQALLLLGQRTIGANVKATRLARQDFAAGLAALLDADGVLYGSAHAVRIRELFERRGIQPQQSTALVSASDGAGIPSPIASIGADGKSVWRPPAALLQRLPAECIPPGEDILLAADVEDLLAREDEPPYSLLAAGDIMLGGRGKRPIGLYGADYPFAAVRPLLRRSPIVLGNLEGPLARKAEKVDRTYSYRVRPTLATALMRAGVNVVTLANNHLMDCGHAGMLETLAALDSARVAAIGAGRNAMEAHRPVILQSGPWRIGLLGYYWNKRTAATTSLPGSAMDSNEELEADIGALRSQVDRVVVTFHWGIPYAREPLDTDRAKARFAIDCGADAIIGHHPHVVQPFEVYRERPIIYSVGNFTFGSGNSRAEGLLAGVRFEPARVVVDLFPLYVKNRDPRIDYQPKLMAGGSASRVLTQMAGDSGRHGARLEITHWRGRLVTAG
ncbi:MAG TPA: CapA family protein [Ktedonobacterales bacterium]